LKSGKACEDIYDRAEDMVATTKRHPSRTRHKTAITKDGKLLAMDIEFVYRWWRLLHTFAGPSCLAAQSRRWSIFLSQRAHRASAVATNIPPHGAFGFGRRRSIFALERTWIKCRPQSD